jgi:hypothetical protein
MSLDKVSNTEYSRDQEDQILRPEIFMVRPTQTMNYLFAICFYNTTSFPMWANI